jgi:hypothetical protein
MAWQRAFAVYSGAKKLFLFQKPEFWNSLIPFKIKSGRIACAF